MKIKSIQEENQRHTQVISELIGQLKAHILSLPDNPRINRISNSPRCFTMSSKDLGGNWSVEHHDFKKQYQMIVEQLENSELSNTFNKLQNIITGEKIVVSNSGSFGLRTSNTFQLHPDVVANLRKMADMPPVNCPACHGEREWIGKGIKAICHFCGK